LIVIFIKKDTYSNVLKKEIETILSVIPRQRRREAKKIKDSFKKLITYYYLNNNILKQYFQSQLI
jgi:hypothetical protein